MQERDLVDAELYAARQTAAMALVIESEFHQDADIDENGSQEDPVQDIPIGGVSRINPGESVKAFSHDRPAQGISPFRSMLRGDLAGSLRLPKRYFNRDVSDANYSSMRADMLDEIRLLDPVTNSIGHQTAGRLYHELLPYISARIGRVIETDDYRLVPDGQPYVDPVKDVQASILAIASGMSDYETEIGKHGRDYRQVWKQRTEEVELQEKLGLDFQEEIGPVENTGNSTKEAGKSE